MRNVYLKLTASIVGAFIGGMTTCYNTTPKAPLIALIMAGLVPVGAYLMGWSQLNPYLKRRRS